MVDVSSFIVSMHIAHLNLYSSSASGAGGVGESSFTKNGSTGTGFRFLEFCKKEDELGSDLNHPRPPGSTREELQVYKSVLPLQQTDPWQTEGISPDLS